jgi:hypothetical protein
MNITSLNKMEHIVADNKSLSWDGWTVVESKLDAASWMKPNAAFIGGKWYLRNRYPVDQNGWTIPRRFVR